MINKAIIIGNLGGQMDSKVCAVCGAEFTRPAGRTNISWEKRKFCSRGCATRERWSTTGFKRESTPVKDRFWRFVEKGDKNECWEWSGATDGHGYGSISIGKGLPPKKAHRTSWEIHFGGIPLGLDVCHACDNPLCVNPLHLMIGSRMANMVDASRKNRLLRITRGTHDQPM